jgi:uncharacterized membrane protein
MNTPSHTTTAQNVFRIILSLFMISAAIGHLTFQRTEFQAQVPNWFPVSKDLTVILSGIVEAGFGLALLVWKKERVKIGIGLAIFYVFIFPGNIAQYLNHTNAFGLNTDNARLARLFFQPVLIFWALWCTGALRYLKAKK